MPSLPLPNGKSSQLSPCSSFGTRLVFLKNLKEELLVLAYTLLTFFISFFFNSVAAVESCHTIPRAVSLENTLPSLLSVMPSTPF